VKITTGYWHLIPSWSLQMVTTDGYGYSVFRMSGLGAILSLFIAESVQCYAKGN